MKNSYNKKMLLDYVSGNDLNDIQVEELENNYLFMMDVIKYTKDKNMYNLCSDNVKNNYEFVRFMVQTFSNDQNFISEIANEYLLKVDQFDISAIELNILMSNLILDKKSNFSIQASIMYQIYLDEMKKFLIKENSDVNYGFNFSLIEFNFNTSNIIIEYFAKRLINDIFCNDDNLSFEEILHINFRKYEDLEKMGLNKFLINYIGAIDLELSNYVICHIDLLSDLKKDIVRIEKNWDKYIDRINRNKILIFYDDVYKYLQEFNYDFDYNSIIYYTVKKLNLLEIFRKYDELESVVDIKNYKNPKTMNIDEMQFQKYVFEFLNELFKSDIININLDDYNANIFKEEKAKVIYFDSKQRALESKKTKNITDNSKQQILEKEKTKSTPSDYTQEVSKKEKTNLINFNFENNNSTHKVLKKQKAKIIQIDSINKNKK